MPVYEPLETDARLIVYLDIKSPYAYLAKDPTKQLTADFGIEIDWRPLTLDIPSYLGSAKVNNQGKVVESKRSSKQWEFVRYSYMDAKRYARINDIKLYGTQKIWDTRLVHIAFLFVKEQFPERFLPFLDFVYERFWLRDLDVESLAVIQDTFARLDIPRQDFAEYADGPGGSSHDQLQASLHPAGIFGVPTYVIDQELFFGRENLTHIRWILSGREGQAPDMAYQAFHD